MFSTWIGFFLHFKETVKIKFADVSLTLLKKHKIFPEFCDIEKKNLFNTEVGKWGRNAQHYIENRHKDQFIFGDKLQKHVVVTLCSDRSLCVYRRIFMKIFVSSTEFCPRNKSYKFKLIWFFATCCSNKIQLCTQRFSQKFSSRVDFHANTRKIYMRKWNRGNVWKALHNLAQLSRLRVTVHTLPPFYLRR